MNRIIKIDEVMRIYKEFMKCPLDIFNNRTVGYIMNDFNLSYNLACRIVQMGRIRSWTTDKYTLKKKIDS